MAFGLRIGCSGGSPDEEEGGMKEEVPSKEGFEMKRMIVFLCALMMAFGTAMPASAALVTITFDEPGISPGSVPGTQGDGDLITDQYAAWGVNWIVDSITTQPHNEVTVGEWFNNPFDIGSANQILWYNGNPVEGNIQLDFPADSLAFDYRKPSDSDPMNVELYNGLNKIYESGIFYAEGFWKTFTYDGSNGAFDRVLMFGPKKFVIDNLEINAVPIPSALLLLGSGLIPVVIRRVRKRSAS
jgi:hypothetical protein